MSFVAIEEAWLSHIPEFPFHMSIGKDISQFVVHNKKEFLFYVYNSLGQDVFTAVNSIEDRNEEIFRTVYIDIDCEADLNESIRELIILVDFLDEIEYDYRVYFSGNKGFAVYIDFKPTKIEKYRQKLILLIDSLIDVFEFKYLDRGVCIDVRRISRLPYTINTKSMRFCHPIRKELLRQLTIDQLGIINDIEKVSKINLNKDFPEILNDIKIVEEVIEYTAPKSDLVTEFNYLLKYSKQLIAGVRHHAVRLKIIPTLVMKGHNDDYILQVCNDFYMKLFKKFNATDYNWCVSVIRSVRSKNLKPIRLDRFRKNYGIKGNIGL
jgi:DNA primase catalytic subunit